MGKLIYGVTTKKKKPKVVELIHLRTTWRRKKEIPIQIVDKESYERDSVFYVELGDPRTEEVRDIFVKVDENRHSI
ncbi:hypothetical protein CDAR_72441 [Caerostris darwini]|uniref:Uncharacterized protein n=1 Tax=Caerostris darwini TaxID=1538125 RepID=A0AAV4MM15_9ARAC|nr:hypothetical protein CDAR_72441 [Caerostris darwini]